MDADLTIFIEDPRSPLGEKTFAPQGFRATVKSASGNGPLDALESADSDYLLWVAKGANLDAGLLDTMWAKRDDGEVVLASRYVRGGGSGYRFPASILHRRVSRLLRKVLRLSCYDPLSGVRLYAKAALDEIPASARARCGPLEILVRLENLGFRTREVARRSTEPAGLLRAMGELGRSVASLARLRRLRNSPDAADADERGFRSHLPWRRRRLERRQQTIVGCLEVDVPVLDVGCGSGRLVQTVAKAVGLDKDRKKLRFLRGRARATVAGELDRLPFQDGSFPQVVCADVLSPLAADASYLPELHRVLSRHGTLVLAGRDGARGSSEAALKQVLERNGFAVDEVRKLSRKEAVVRAIRRETKTDPAG